MPTYSIRIIIFSAKCCVAYLSLSCTQKHMSSNSSSLPPSTGSPPESLPSLSLRMRIFQYFLSGHSSSPCRHFSSASHVCIYTIFTVVIIIKILLKISLKRCTFSQLFYMRFSNVTARFYYRNVLTSSSWVFIHKGEVE